MYVGDNSAKLWKGPKIDLTHKLIWTKSLNDAESPKLCMPLETS